MPEGLGSKSPKLRIVNKTGKVHDTEIYVDDVKLPNVKSVEIYKIDIEQPYLTAKLEVWVSELDVTVDGDSVITEEVEEVEATGILEVKEGDGPWQELKGMN